MASTRRRSNRTWSVEQPSSTTVTEPQPQLIYSCQYLVHVYIMQVIPGGESNIYRPYPSASAGYSVMIMSQDLIFIRDACI